MISRNDARFALRAFLAALGTAAAIVFLPDALGSLRTHSLALIDAAASTLPGEDEAAGSETTNLRVIDGDTVEDRATGVRYRLSNIDTPETGGREHCAAERELGERATEAARRLIAEADRIEVRPVGRIDRYGRTVAYVNIDGRDFGAEIMSRGLARPWRGRREPWCSASGGLLN